MENIDSRELVHRLVAEGMSRLILENPGSWGQVAPRTGR